MLQAKDEFVVLACDGIYDVMSNEQVHCFVEHHLTVRAVDMGGS